MIISSTNWELGVQSYLNLCNITATTPRKQLRDFAAGVDDLGLWSNMVCWPLRSSQNAGTGTTAYSLGGLGTFNGTLVNGPTWGTDGVNFTGASSHYISLGSSQIIGGNSDYSVMGVGQLTNSAVSAISMISTGNNRGAAIGASNNGSTQLRVPVWRVDGTSPGAQFANGPTTSHFAAFAAGDASSAKNYINSGTPFVTLSGDHRTNPSSANVEMIGGITIPSFAPSWNGLVSAGAFFNAKLTDEQVGSVYALLKTTLSQGLSLP
jgi:hypothetical protein